jgi:hypothetical protein
MQAVDHLFVVRIAYFLDRVFQYFTNDLGNNRLSGDIPGTISAAKGELEREHTNLIHSILGQIRIQVAPPIQLPASLLANDNQMETDTPSSSRTLTTNQMKKKTPEMAAKADKEKDGKTAQAACHQRQMDPPKRESLPELLQQKAVS